MPDAESELDVLLETSSLKMVGESKLSIAWDGLDCIYVIEDLLTPFGRRQLQGFIAAGGEVKNMRIVK